MGGRERQIFPARQAIDDHVQEAAEYETERHADAHPKPLGQLGDRHAASLHRLASRYPLLCCRLRMANEPTLTTLSLDRYLAPAKALVSRAQALADERRHMEVQPLHLLAR